MLTLHSPMDMHVHLRQGDMLSEVAPWTAKDFAAAVIMPNLTPPVTGLDQLMAYKVDVLRAAGHPFQPLMTLFFRPYSREELERAREHIIGVKLYPAGMTTNSENGVRDMHQAMDTLAVLEELDIPLLVHGEGCGFVMDREHAFLPVIRDWARSFPRLRIMLEHITTSAAVELLEELPNLYATVTLHHLMITLDDLAGGLLRPHLFCKPIAKRPEDRDALRRTVLEHPRVFFGSDSAPHPRSAKEAPGCAAGIFSAPVALPALAGLFEEMDALDRLQAFVSDRARAAYGITPPDRIVRLHRRTWSVPERMGPVVPFLAGERLVWSVAD